MIEAKVKGNISVLVKELKELSEIGGTKQVEFMKLCCKSLLTSKGAMRDRAFVQKQDPVTGKAWKQLSGEWLEIRRQLGINPHNILRFGFVRKENTDKKKKNVKSKYRTVNSKGVLYDNINYKVVKGDGYVGTDEPYAKRHNRGLGRTPQRRFLGTSKKDYKFFTRILSRIMKDLDKKGR
jgi:phage gpG-like protein